MEIKKNPIQIQRESEELGASDISDVKRNAIKKTIKTYSEFEDVFTVLVIFGVAIEFFAPIFASPELSPSLVSLGNAYVVIGLLVEFFAGSKAKKLQEELTEQAYKELIESNTARIELEKKLLPRSLNQEQWDFVQGLKDELPRIAIAYETDAEPRWFARSIQDAFMLAGISVAMYPRAADVHSFGMFVYDPKGFEGARPVTARPLLRLIGMTEVIGTLAVITEVPTDILESRSKMRPEMCAPLDTPMLIIGGRFTLPPPHLERLAKAAKLQRDRINASEIAAKT